MCCILESPKVHLTSWAIRPSRWMQLVHCTQDVAAFDVGFGVDGECAKF